MNSKQNVLKTSIVYILLIFGSFLMLLPFLWMLSTSLKKGTNVFLVPPQWIPNPIMFSNYFDVVDQLPFLSGFFNSLYITALTTLGLMFFSSIAAYAFAKIKFKFKEFIFALYLLTMMVPLQTVLIPQFIIFTNIGWVDQHYGLIIPYMLTSGFSVFMLRQFFSGIPDALVEAAKIDGCPQPKIFSAIMLPQIKPALASVAIFSIIARWNDFLAPFILLTTESKFTLPLIMNSLKGQFGSRWELMMAAATMSLLPIIIVYIFTQRYFVEGITLSGVKG